MLSGHFLMNYCPRQIGASKMPADDVTCTIAYILVKFIFSVIKWMFHTFQNYMSIVLFFMKEKMKKKKRNGLLNHGGKFHESVK